MEGLSKIFGARIILSEETYQQLSHPEAFHFQFLGKVQVKGRQQPTGIYECLDGWPEEKRDALIATSQSFSQALEAYYAKDFAKASVLFKQVLAHHPDHKSAQRYLEQSARFLVSGVPDDWTGVEMMGEK
jgi:hypothetical protein